MYTHNRPNGDMLLNELIDYSLGPRWTNLNNLNSNSVVSVSGESVRTNDAVKQQSKAHYEKGISQLDNRFSNVGHPNCSNVIKYPRVFRPVILQQHPDYSTQILPQPYETTLQSGNPFISNDRNKQSHPDFLCSYSDLNKPDKYAKYDKHILQLQFSISESARMHHRFSSQPDYEVANKFLTLNSPEANLQSMNSFMKHTNFDFPYVPENNQQNINKPVKWPSFQNDQFYMTNTDIKNSSFNIHVCPYRKAGAQKTLFPNWLSTTKEINKYPDKADKTQQYHEVLINSKDPSALNQFNSSNCPSDYEASSKRSGLGKPMFTLENSENPFSNLPNLFNNNSDQSAVLSNLYYSPFQNKIVTNKLTCPYCNFFNSSPAQLKIHLRIHTGERPYVCDILGCDKTFTRNEELTRHLKIHSGDRPYICKICKRSFGRKDHLTKHEVTHRSQSDKKVHICLVGGCKQRYTRSDALARHRWNVHFIRPEFKTKRQEKRMNPCRLTKHEFTLK